MYFRVDITYPIELDARLHNERRVKIFN